MAKSESEGKKQLDKVQTMRFRVSFPSVFHATAMEEDGEKKYSLVGIVEPDKFTAEEKKIWREMHRIFDKCWQERWKGKKPGNLKSPFRDGEEKGHLDGYGEGKVFFTMSTKSKPGLIDRTKERITEEEDFYAGCFARATVTCYSYERKGNRGVAFGLHNIQKVGDGPKFSGIADAEEDFDETDDQSEGVEDNDEQEEHKPAKSSKAPAKKGKSKDDDEDFLN